MEHVEHTTGEAIPQVPPPRHASAISMVEAMTRARSMVAEMTGLTVDAVTACRRRDTDWLTLVDVIESPARLGDNDLLATYEITLDSQGEVTGFQRTGRYNREDKAGQP